jgi:hypothetical protein
MSSQLLAAHPPPLTRTFDHRSKFPAKASRPEGPPSHIFQPEAEAPLQQLNKYRSNLYLEEDRPEKKE